MKALVYTANEETTFRDEPEPVPGAGEALIRDRRRRDLRLRHACLARSRSAPRAAAHSRP